MQIEETTNEGLKRAYAVTIPAKDIDAAIEAEVKKIAPQVRMPGFRPGKVPANLVRKMHGEALHAQVRQRQVREAIDKLMRDKNLRPAMQPEVRFGDGYEEGKDAKLSVELEVLPEIEAPPTRRAQAREADRAGERRAKSTQRSASIAGQQKSYTDAPKSKKAADGDQLIIDFVGSIDGVEFEGGKAEDAPLVIGSGRFIPGFEEQLAGVKAGDEKTITVTFPADYPAEDLAGKDAQFDVTVQEVQVAGETKVDDDFAKSLGLESLDQLTACCAASSSRNRRADPHRDEARSCSTSWPPATISTCRRRWSMPSSSRSGSSSSRKPRSEEDPGRRAEGNRGREGRLPQHRRAPRAPRPAAVGNRPGQRRRRSRQQEMSMLIQQAAQQYRPEDRERFIEYVRTERHGRRPAARAALRGQGRRLPVRQGRSHRARSDPRGTAGRDRGRGKRASPAAKGEAAKARKKAAAKKPAAAAKAEEAAPAKKADAPAKAEKAPPPRPPSRRRRRLLRRRARRPHLRSPSRQRRRAPARLRRLTKPPRESSGQESRCKK